MTRSLLALRRCRLCKAPAYTYTSYCLHACLLLTLQSRTIGKPEAQLGVIDTVAAVIIPGIGRTPTAKC